MKIHNLMQSTELLLLFIAFGMSGCGSKVAFKETGGYNPGGDSNSSGIPPESGDATAATNDQNDPPPEAPPPATSTDVAANGDPETQPEVKTDLEDKVASEGVVSLCEDAARVVTKEVEIDFESTLGLGCEIKGQKIAANMTAYRRQVREIEIPAGTVLCDFELKTEEQEVTYDDELLMTFNDFFLAGANHTSEVLESFGMEKTGELVKWDWEKHYNTKRDHDMGGCSLSVECEFPATQTKGALTVKVPSDWLEELPVEQQSQQKFTLSVITTGNQNSKTDCSHTGFKFKSTIKYVVPE